MADETPRDVPMARPDRPREKDAVRTTIVGGRPPGSGTDIGPIPRGIEVLVKKASVDAEFKALLLGRRAEAAKGIELELDPAEVMMLNAVAAAQLEAIIDNTVVSPMTRAAFLGRAASAMLVALSAGAAIEPIAADAAASRGSRPPPPTGIRPGLRARYAVYEERNYKGQASYEVIETRAYAAKAARVAAANRWMRRAYALARRAWSEDPERRGAPFPLAAPQPMRCRSVATFSGKAAAEAAMKQRQERIDAKHTQEREEQEKRLAAMTDEEREKETERAERLKAAEELFEKHLETLLKSPAPVPTTKGIRPDRPSPRRGIRPDRR